MQRIKNEWKWAVGGILFTLFFLSFVISIIQWEQAKVKRLEAIYDKGFNMVMVGIPDNPTQIVKEDERILSVLKNFKSKIRWAEIRGENIFFSEEEGAKIKYPFMVIIPEDHRLLNQQEMIAELKTGSKANFLTIKPVKITPEWAGFLLVHELVHLYDFTFGVLPKRLSQEEVMIAEARAYKIQVVAVDGFTRGGFSKAVKEIIAKHSFKDTDFILASFESNPQKFDLIFCELDKTILQSPPLSYDERLERDLFYLVAICFINLEQRQKTEGGYSEVISKLWNISKAGFDKSESGSRI